MIPGGVRAPRARRTLLRSAPASLLLAAMALLGAACADIEDAAPGGTGPTTSVPGPASPLPDGSPTGPGGSSPATDGDGGTGDPSPAAAAPRFEPSDCRFDEPAGYTVRCGDLVTEQNRARPDGTKVRLHVGVFHKDGATVAADPVVYLDGGPGGNALQAATLDFDNRFGGFAATRDVIVFDQRGTGFSEPRLDCEGLGALLYDQLDDTGPNARQLEAQQSVLAGCRADLVARGVDLARYNSVASAADVAELRTALGYGSWNLLGVSYGTRLAQTILRTDATGIRSVILDSTYPVAADSLVGIAGHMQQAFDHFFAACRADAACDARYPDLEARFVALVDRLGSQPVKLTVTDFVTGDDHPMEVTGSDLVDLLFMSLYDAGLFTAMPQVIDDLEAGRTDSLQTLQSVSISQLPFITLGMHVTVQCHEEVAFAQPAAVDAAVAAHPLLAESIAGQLIDSPAGFETCRVWNAGSAPPEENLPVTSDVPTLILSGGFDPITPGDAAREVGRTLSRSTFVAFDGLGHGVAMEPGCPQSIAVAFLAEPTAPVDSACAATVPAPRFTASPPAAAIRLEPFEEEMAGSTVVGVRPAGWAPAGVGAVALYRNVLHSTLLVQQAVPRVDPGVLLAFMSDQISVDGEFTPDGSTDAGGVRWNRYRARAAGDEVDLALAERDGLTLAVLLLSEPAERDRLLSAVLEPALGALRTD